MSNRSNLDHSDNSKTYLTLTIILIILSLVSLSIFYVANQRGYFNRQTIPGLTPAPNNLPQPTDLPTPEPDPDNTNVPSPIPSLVPTNTPVPPADSPTPTPVYTSFTSESDAFSLSYKSHRRLYQDKESTGNRYTLYSPDGNIAVHVGNSWSWTYPERQFSDNLIVSGHPTFVYDIDTQTIVDLTVGDVKYTIQCVHNNLTILKDECRQFLSDFKVIEK